MRETGPRINYLRGNAAWPGVSRPAALRRGGGPGDRAEEALADREQDGAQPDPRRAAREAPIAEERPTGAPGARLREFSGAVQGDLRGSEAVLIERGGKVVGDLSAPRIGIADGGLVRGHVRTDGDASAAPPRRQVVAASPPLRSVASTAAGVVAGFVPPKPVAKAEPRVAPPLGFAADAEPESEGPTLRPKVEEREKPVERRPPPPVLPSLGKGAKAKAQVAAWKDDKAMQAELAADKLWQALEAQGDKLDYEKNPKSRPPPALTEAYAALQKKYPATCAARKAKEAAKEWRLDPETGKFAPPEK